jgi:hypothetical protein
MSKIFGYSKKGGRDWFSSDAYGDREIEAIKDPEGGSEVFLPTAIPSPFARIDLVKTAFSNMAKSPDLRAYITDGDVIASKEDERLVSHSLDLMEMLFNIDSLPSKPNIIVWDKHIELQQLKDSSGKHKRFAETLELYLQQDSHAYNFDLLQRLFLIEYNHKIIGSTSPATLFFATANDLTHAQIKLTTNDILFDDEYAPLYERDSEFQKYFHLLLKANPILQERMPEVNDYLKKNLAILNTKSPKLYTEINGLRAGVFLTMYSELNTGTANDEIEVLGVGLKKRKTEDLVGFISENSDFRISSTKYQGSKKPLVLQNDFPKQWMYARDKWQKFKVPFIEVPPLERRRLPEINVTYPYLTISDFLEPYLIRLVYPVNKEKFFDGNLIFEVGDESKGYILPLKKQFFDFFDTVELTSSLPKKPKIELIHGTAGSVKVILKIPVEKQDEYISFERIYKDSKGYKNEELNQGEIVEHQFGMTLFPFIKTNSPSIKAYYRIQLIDRDVIGPLKNTEYDLKFFSNDSPNEIEVRAKKIRSSKKQDAAETATSQYYVLHNEFDFIQVKNVAGSGASGIIIPNWQPYHPGNEVFTFAIDFGTTNTHIEYKIGNGSPKPFDVTADDVQIATLFHPTKTSDDFGGTGAIAIRELIDHEFIPQHLGHGSEYKFPHRTVLAEGHALNIETETFTLADFNIPFTYERKPERDRIQSNLKWSKREKGNEKRIRAFFEKLIMLLRNKVLFNRGDLSETRLIWFYPSSMKPARKSSLENAWNELFEQYFHSNHKPIGITESLAPFYYFKGANRLQGGAYKPVVSVDIGGGTTDIVVFKSNKPLLLTSFKFAANTIFGDGFSEYGAASSNGLISKYLHHYEHLLSINKLYDLSKVLLSIKEKNRTEDLNAFFFSIENNPKIKDKKLFSYNSLLGNDEDLKIIFLYFYTSIIYHIAEVMKNTNVELPKHLIFSGTGSKILNIITTDLKTLALFSKKVFEGVYGQQFDSDGLTIETEKEMPKEVTCKGGLMSNPEDLAIDVRNIKAVLTCVESNGVSKLTYDKLDDATKTNIANYVRNFNSFFLSLNQQFNFTDHFNISEKSFQIFRTESNKHLRDYLEEGLEFNKKLDEIDGNDKEIEESLFFYPLIGAINNLSGQLSALTPVNS